MNNYRIESPDLINIETTQRCNLKCRMCGRVDKSAADYRHTDMDMDVFMKATPLMQGVKSIWLSGFGEPLLHKNLAEMVAISKKFGPSAKVGFTTNAMLLTEDKSRELIDAGLDQMQVSVDGSTKWGHVGGGANLQKVIANLKRLNELKAEKGVSNPEILFAFVAMKDNMHELLEVLDVAATLKVKFFTLQPLRPSTEEIRKQNIYRNLEYAKKYVEAAREKAKSLGIIFEAQFMDFDMSSQRRDCSFPKWFISIAYDGSVYMCCAGMPAWQNVKETAIGDIWNSEIYLKLRQSIDTGDLPVKCRSCSIMYNTIENQEKDIPEKAVTLIDKIKQKGFFGSIRSATAITKRRLGIK
jgi:radical SAM protein with 4Fe4S-binding SPASM domain